MTSRYQKHTIELEKRIKSCPVDFLRVDNLIKRARKDLATARHLWATDLDVAYTLLYDCMLHAGIAFMSVSGVRPDVRGKHKTVIEYVASILGSKYKSHMECYDRMRRKRHLLIYEPGPNTCTEKEMEETEQMAKDFLGLICDKIKAKNPQQEFDF